MVGEVMTGSSIWDTKKHFRVQHSHNEFSNKHSHINGIESFWSYAKTRLVRFRGLQK